MQSTRFTTVSALVFAIASSSAFGSSHRRSSMENRDFGLGVIFGSPTGISAKAWTSRESAFDFGLSFSFNNYVLLYSDFLYHFPNAFQQAKERFVRELTPYIGIGPLVAFSASANQAFAGSGGPNSAVLGARIPLGMEWLPNKTPIGVFLELVPGITLLPSTNGFAEGGLGIRYYF